jgi:hypothetical protein
MTIRRHRATVTAPMAADEEDHCSYRCRSDCRRVGKVDAFLPDLLSPDHLMTFTNLNFFQYFRLPCMTIPPSSEALLIQYPEQAAVLSRPAPHLRSLISYTVIKMSFISALPIDGSTPIYRLSDDCLLLVISEVKTLQTPWVRIDDKPLKELAQTNRRLRALCLPHLVQPAPFHTQDSKEGR